MHANDLLDSLNTDVVLAAQNLLGARIVWGECSAIIVETEAYRASDDPASHAYRGLTRRNSVMFDQAGFAYVYLNYGMHWMLNVTAHPKGEAAAVLIRAAMPVSGLETMRERRSPHKAFSDKDLLSGPGKLTQALGIWGGDNGKYLLGAESPFRIEPATTRRTYGTDKRVGIAKGKGDEILWRFIDQELISWSSSPRPKMV